MKIILLLLCFGLFSCTNDNGQDTTSKPTPVANNKTPKAKLWELRTLKLIKKENRWHFETKQGGAIEQLGAWDSVAVMAIDRSGMTSRIVFRQDTVNYILRSRFKDNRFNSFYLLAKDSAGVEYLLPSVTSNYYKVAMSIEALNATTEALWLHGSSLSELSAVLSEYAQLKVLALSHGSLEALSEGIGRLQNLEQLYVQYNKVPLHLTPNSWSTLKNLRLVNFSRTALANLETSLSSTTDWDNLEYLNLSSCQLTDIPEQIFEFKNLTHLNLSRNKIQRLSQKIGQLSQLQYISLRSTDISNIPKTMENLVHLHYFNTNYTRLKTLSIDLKKYPKLTSFHTTYDLAEKIEAMYPDIYISGSSSYE